MAATTVGPKSRITARVPASIQMLLEQAAAYLGVPVNSFMVTAAVEKATELLAAEQTIQLGGKDAVLFQTAGESAGSVCSVAGSGERLPRDDP